MMKPITFLAVAALIVAGALVNGAVTQRWSVLGPNPEVTERFHALELRFEDWRSEVTPTEMPMNERCSAVARRYIAPRSGHSAAVTVFSGIPGAVATHTPDVCYPGSGYTTIRGPRKETLTLPNGEMVEFYIADFEKKTKTRRERARVRWAWTTDGHWVAPDNPRWQFARELTSAPMLYKLYLVTPLPETDGTTRPEDDAVTQEFIRTAWTQYASAFAK